jgi:hypothetical protein
MGSPHDEPARSLSAARAMTEEEAAAAILDIAAWLRYAEGTAEQRLYSFVMAATLLLLGCATILASADAPLFVASVLAGCGLVLSLLWVIIGERQGKYHHRLGREANRLLRTQGAPGKFAIKYVQDVEFSPESVRDEARLNRLERWLSTRTFMWLVPTLFGTVFVVIFAFTLL